jgi:hypothetical protein
MPMPTVRAFVPVALLYFDSRAKTYNAPTTFVRQKRLDTVRPILEDKLFSVLEKGQPWSQHFTLAHFIVAVTCIQEMTDGYPTLSINHQVAHVNPTDPPSVCIFSDFDAGIGKNTVAVVAETDIFYNPRWHCPVVNCLYEWLTAVDDLGLDICTELRETVLRGNKTTSIAQYLIAPTFS